MDLSGTQVQTTTNYLVPSSGDTHCVPIIGNFTPVPTALDWRQFSESSFPFQPQGVFVDNTQNANALTITILPLGWNINVAPGAQLMTPFPAPAAQTASIVSANAGGNASIYFVDFPVLPYSSSASGGTPSSVTPSPQSSASAANLGLQPVANVQLATEPGEWTLTNAPVAATAASATRAATAGIRHILKSINASVIAVAAQAAPLLVVVRDGLTGVGTILWQDKLVAPVGFSDRLSIPALNIAGTTGNAMTVEFTSAPAAGNFATISATGYDAT